MSDFEIIMVHILNILAKVSMTALVYFAIYAFILIPVFRSRLLLRTLVL